MHSKLAVAVFVFVIMTVTFGESNMDPCFMRLLPPSGIVLYPLQPSQTINQTVGVWWNLDDESLCTLYMFVEPAQYIDLIFRRMQLGNNSIKVEVSKFRRGDRWYKLRTIKGPKTEQTLSFRGFRTIRITIPKRGPRFFLFYLEKFCFEPNPKMVVKQVCDRSYLKKSQCFFSCNKPKYFPIGGDEEKFYSRCQEDRTWSTDFTEHCGTVKRIIKRCFDLPELTCNYTVEKLADMATVKEIAYEETREFEELEKIARRKFMWKNKPKRRGKTFDVVPFHKCVTHCMKIRSSPDHVFACNWKKLTLERKRDCLACRFAGDRCKGYTVWT